MAHGSCGAAGRACLPRAEACALPRRLVKSKRRAVGQNTRDAQPLLVRQRSAERASDVLRDVRVAMRSCARERSFTLTVLATLGRLRRRNTVTFSVVGSVLLEPLPIAGADPIVLVSNLYPTSGVRRGASRRRCCVRAGLLRPSREIHSFEEVMRYQRWSVALLICAAMPRFASIPSKCPINCGCK